MRARAFHARTHPEGTSIEVHYNPANPGKAALVETDMPGGGPHTPNNLKLLGIATVSSIVLLGIARIARPRSETVLGQTQQGSK